MACFSVRWVLAWCLTTTNVSCALDSGRSVASDAAAQEAATAATCDPVPPLGAMVSATVRTSPFPPHSGGEIADGEYRLSAIETPTASKLTASWTITVQGSTWRSHEREVNGSSSSDFMRELKVLRLMSNTLDMDTVCTNRPELELIVAHQWFYTAMGSVLIISLESDSAHGRFIFSKT